MNTNTDTVEAQFNAAVERIRTAAPFTINLMSCCRSYATAADLNLSEKQFARAFAYTYGGQCNELIWEDGRPLYRDEEDDECRCVTFPEETEEDAHGYEVVTFEEEFRECDLCVFGFRPRRTRPAKVLYIYHQTAPGEELLAARAVQAAFTAHGFRVDWDGTASDAVQVHLDGA